MITNSFYSTRLVLNRNLSEVQLQCSAIESNAISSFEFKSTLIIVSLMVVSAHQSEKLSQLQSMLEAGRAGPKLTVTAKNIGFKGDLVAQQFFIEAQTEM